MVLGVVQADLIGSLQARVDLLTAEAEDMAGGAAPPAPSTPPLLTPPSAQPGAHTVLRLPARVFFPVQVHTPFRPHRHIHVSVDAGR